MRQIAMLRKYRIRPQKKWGQHFLVDENIQRRILEVLDLGPQDTVLEIGAGLGALTEGLAASGAGVLALEKDKTLAEILSRELEQHPNLRVLNQDILKLDFATLAGGGKGLKIVGNLPYSITTPILFHLIDQRKWIHFAVITIQKEVADRLLARPRSKAYGRLTLAFRYYGEVVRKFDIASGAFSPSPKVASSVLKISFPSPQHEDLNEELLFKIIQAAFALRRKTILNSLTASSPVRSRAFWQPLLAEAGIPENKRAEELDLKDYIRLTGAAGE